MSTCAALFERYAIYWAPESDSQLSRLDESWFGGDRQRGTFGLDPAVAGRIKRSAARYGLHGTLKAPFRLAPGATLSDLTARLHRFAEQRAPIHTSPLQLTDIDGFLALCPQPPSLELIRLAHMVVLGFDEFRAPLEAADRERRVAGGLNTHQRLLLEQWGYPHVLSEFRFHVTLTDRMPNLAIRGKVKAALADALAPLEASPFELRSICLFGDPGEDKHLELIERFPLNGS